MGYKTCVVIGAGSIGVRHCQIANDMFEHIYVVDPLERAQRNIVEKSIGMDVTYHGLIKDKLKLYEMISNSNFFVFPSIQEAMSMMLLEVASIGVPLIVSDIQENKDVFSDNEVLFFKSDDELDLKNKIIFALSYPDVMLKKSTAAKIKVDNTYNWSVISDRYSEIYNDLVGRK